jgi:enterochelin esterase-like enzyme
MTRRQARPTRPLFASLLALLALLLGACQRQAAPSSTIPTETPDRPVAIPNTPTPDATDQAATEMAQPTATSDCSQQGGTLLSESMHSDALAEDLFYDIYLPPCYGADPETRYPVVYLLHGLSYRQDQWPRLGLVTVMDELIAAGEIPPFIAVMPLEAPFTPPQVSQFGNALVNDLIPWVDEHYQTLPGKASRAIAGVSRGAAWALHLGFEHNELFARVGAHSLPLFEADGRRLPNWMARADEDLPLFFIDIGRNDPEWQTAEEFANLLDENGIPHEWYLLNGGHTEAYWSSHLGEYLRWYSADWWDTSGNEVK